MTHTPPLRLAPRSTDAHKGDFGRAVLIGGSRGMSGSIALSAMAALRCGAGLVTAAVPDRCLETVAGFHPAVMTLPLADDSDGRFSVAASGQLKGMSKQASAIGCGPGMTGSAGSFKMVERLLATYSIPRVFDADAINIMAEGEMLRQINPIGPAVLTPHPGELQRLCGISRSDRDWQLSAAAELSVEHNLVVVVKGGPTVVIVNGQRWTNSTGNPGMATAGSGDVLTGLITGLLAQKLPIGDAARLGVWIHGRAGDLAAEQCGQVGMTATDLLDHVPAAVSEAC